MRHRRRGVGACGGWTALVGLILGAGVGPAPARAQSVPAFEHVDVTLWPEYDRSAMLVICRATLAAGAQLPTVLTLPMPAAVETPHAVAHLAANGTLLVADYTRDVVGDVAWVRVTTDSPDVQLEYYQELGRTGERRSFAYRWPAYTDVEAFTFEVQAPPGATEVTVTPKPAREDPGEGGRVFYHGELGRLSKATTGTIEVAYSRKVDGLATVQADTPVAAAGEPSTTGGGGPTWVWAILAVAVVLFTMSIVVFLKSSKKTGS